MVNAPSPVVRPRAPEKAPDARRPRTRTRLPLAFLSFVAALAFVLVNVVDPYSGAIASPYYQAPARFDGDPAQRLVVTSTVQRTVQRDTFGAEAAPPPPPPPEPTPTPTPTPAPTATKTAEAEAEEPAAEVEEPTSEPVVATAEAPSPGTAKAIAYDMVVARGWADSEYNCLVLLWNRESGWNVTAENTSSGAYGIPQALPGSKMASVAGDWRTNAGTQITWGLGYIEGRYGSPCGAWAHSEDMGWY